MNMLDYRTSKLYLKLNILCSDGKKLFHILERFRQIEYNNLVFVLVCIVLVGYPAQLPPIQIEIFWIVCLPSSNIDDKNSNELNEQFNDAVLF